MKVNVILFGQLTDIAGSSVTLGNVVDTAGLVAEMHRIYPALDNFRYVIAVDKQVVSENTALNNNSTVVLLPPFSGG